MFTTLRQVNGASAAPSRRSLRTRRPFSPFSHRIVTLPWSRTLRSHARSAPDPTSAIGASAISGYASTWIGRFVRYWHFVPGDSFGFFSQSESQSSASDRIVTGFSAAAAGAAGSAERYASIHVAA